MPLASLRGSWSPGTLSGFRSLVLFALLCLLPLAGSLLRLGAVLPLAIYALVSLLTFFLYWRDKHSALKDHWRTPETTLHFFELAGGWPGALVAQQVFRHKTRKLSYQLTFWLIVAAPGVLDRPAVHRQRLHPRAPGLAAAAALNAKARRMPGFRASIAAQTFLTNSDFSFIAPMPSILQSMS